MKSSLSVWGCLLGEGRERKSRQQDWQREQEPLAPLIWGFPVWARGRSACLAPPERAKSLQGPQVRHPGALKEMSGDPGRRKYNYETKTGKYPGGYLKKLDVEGHTRTQA